MQACGQVARGLLRDVPVVALRRWANSCDGAKAMKPSGILIE